MITNLVISGGGIKGAAIIGVLEVLEKQIDIDQITTFVGTSIGGLFAFLIAIGYRSQQLKELLKLNIDEFFCIEVKSFLKRYGFDSGETVYRLLKAIIKQKEKHTNITFKQFYEKSGKKIILNGSNLNTHKICYFDCESTPNMSILDAIRITISFPFLFAPIERNGDLYIDGAFFDPFPVNRVTDTDGEKIGIYIENPEIFDKDHIIRYSTDTFSDFLLSFVTSTMNRYLQLNSPEDMSDIICIDCSSISSIKFGASPEIKETLYQKGVEAATIFFEVRTKVSAKATSLQKCVQDTEKPS